MLGIFFRAVEYIVTMKVLFIKKPKLFFVGDQSLEELEQHLNVKANVLLAFNQKQQIARGDILEVPNQNVYVVKPLDTLNGICQKLNISANELLTKNNIRQIFIGQMLYY